MDTPSMTLAPPRATRPSQSLPVAILTLCCVLWGYSFPVMQFATHAFDRHLLAGTPGAPDNTRDVAARALFNALRFALAAALYAAVTWPRQRNFRRPDLLGGMTVGAFFAAGMLLQVTGLRWTFPSVSSFLTALAVVFAPLGQAALLRRPVGRPTWCAVALAMLGMTLLGWPKPDAAAADHTLATPPPIPHLGEALTVAAALLFTGQILAVDRFGARADATRLTLVMLATTSALSFAASALAGPALWRPHVLTDLARDPTVRWTMLTLVAFSSVAALHLMNTYQPRVSPATASVIYCSEPLFGTLFSLLFATERLTTLTLAGGTAVLASVLVVALGAKDPVLPSEGHLGQ